MPRVVSFIVLLAFIMLVGAMFFQVMVQFIVPLFMAAVLVVVFKPVHLWIVNRSGGRPRIGAALTTLTIVLLVLLPLTIMLFLAFSEAATIYSGFVTADEATLSDSNDWDVPPAEPLEVAEPRLDPNEVGMALMDEQGETSSLDQQAVSAVFDRVVDAINPLLADLGVRELESRSVQQYVINKLKSWAAPFALDSVRFIVGAVLSLAIMIVTMYYFFSDGPGMITALKKLSPLEDEYEQELLDKFGDISRSVVVATLAAAVVQGILAGFGYWVAGASHLFLLISATAFMSMVPFVGAASVWGLVCIGLYFYTGNPDYPDGRPWSAIILAIYCACIVSTSDNIIKPLVLHGQAKLHPLLALLSIIGGVQALGPIGILVGPMLVAFLQALLNMLNKELHLLGKEADTKGTPVVFATKEADSQSDKN